MVPLALCSGLVGLAKWLKPGLNRAVQNLKIWTKLDKTLNIYNTCILLLLIENITTEYNSLIQWFSNCGTRAPSSGTRRYLIST